MVLLAVGGTASAAAWSTAHSGALAGADAAWEALSEAHGVLRVRRPRRARRPARAASPTGRRVTRTGPGAGIATVHDSGAERVLVADLADASWRPLRRACRRRDRDAAGRAARPGLVADNPLDVWGTGDDTGPAVRRLPARDGRRPARRRGRARRRPGRGVRRRRRRTRAPRWTRQPRPTQPVVVLTNVTVAVDQRWADALRARGVPVLEGTRSGLRALGHLLSTRPTPRPVGARRHGRRPSGSAGGRTARPAGPLDAVDVVRAARATTAIAGRAPRGASTSPRRRVAAAATLGLPGRAQDRRRRTCAQVRGRRGPARAARRPDAVAAAYDDLARRLGPAVAGLLDRAARRRAVGSGWPTTRCSARSSWSARAVCWSRCSRTGPWPCLRWTTAGAGSALDRLRVRQLLAGVRGGPAADLAAVRAAVVAVGAIALELGDRVRELDVNPLVAGPGRRRRRPTSSSSRR